MLSFHNDPAIKEKYIARLKHHQEMDNIVQRIGWQNGKGCAVGCTLENYTHSRYKRELGLPTWLAYLEDAIFENLSIDKSKKWPLLFLSVIEIGVDVEIVKHQIAIKRLDRLIAIQEKNSYLDIEKILDSLKLAKIYHELALSATATVSNKLTARKKACRSTNYEMLKAKAAEGCMFSSTLSAKYAAQSAMWSTVGKVVKKSVTISVTRSAQFAAESVVYSGDRLTAWQQEADSLIECLKAIKK